MLQETLLTQGYASARTLLRICIRKVLMHHENFLKIHGYKVKNQPISS